MTSSILRIILTTWVANKNCCVLPISVSKTPCSFMSGKKNRWECAKNDKISFCRNRRDGDSKLSFLIFLTICAFLETIDAQSWISLRHLAGLNICQSLYGRKAAVFRKCERDGVQSISKGADGILLDGGDLHQSIRSLKNTTRAPDQQLGSQRDGKRFRLSRHHRLSCRFWSNFWQHRGHRGCNAWLPRQPWKVNNLQRGLTSYHLVSSSDKDGDCLGIFAVLDDNHPLFSCSKTEFSN